MIQWVKRRKLFQEHIFGPLIQAQSSARRNSSGLMPMPARGGGGRLKPIDFEMPQEPEFSWADDATRRHPTTSSAPRRPEVRARVLTPLGARPPVTLLTSIAANGATAFLIILAMTFGLILPRMLLEHFHRPSA
jgi:hypothetical protein